MSPDPTEFLRISKSPTLIDGTLVLSFSGWMDGGNVSTGTVTRLVDLLKAEPIAEIDPELFYIYNFPGSMEVTALFRPHIEIKDGLVETLDFPSNTLYCLPSANLAFFVGQEPNLRWQTFGECVFHLARQIGVRRILFVGSFGGSVPHTREPRLFVTASEERLLPEMEQFGVRRTGYAGPGSFTTYLMTRAQAAGFEMVSLVAEIPGYLQGANPASIEAISRRLAKILKLQLDLHVLRAASTEWELKVSAAMEEDEQLGATIRRLEEEYDTELLERELN